MRLRLHGQSRTIVASNAPPPVDRTKPTLSWQDAVKKGYWKLAHWLCLEDKFEPIEDEV